MLFSCHVIIVNYNAGEWLTRAIESVLKYSDAVITIVDNDSSDQSVKTAQQKYQNNDRVSWILNIENKGFAAANNQVLTNLREDFAVLMNPDCEISEDTIPLLLQAFEQHPTMGLASCKILNEDRSVQKTCRRRFPTPWSSFVRMLGLHVMFPNNTAFSNFDYGDRDFKQEVEFVEAISGAFMMVRKQALQDVGLLDEAYFMHCEDLDWCKRFELSQWKVGFESQTSVVHAKGVSSRSRPIRVLWTLHTGMNRFFDKFYRSEFSLLIRGLTKLGICCSFIARSVVAMLKP